MIIKTMWGKRRSEPNAPPELMVAWDEHRVDDFPEGFEDDCAVARASWSDDLAEWRMIDVEVRGLSIDLAFVPTAPIAGIVVPGEESSS